MEKDYSVRKLWLIHMNVLTRDPAVVSPTTRRGPAPSEAIGTQVTCNKNLEPIIT